MLAQIDESDLFEGKTSECESQEEHLKDDFQVVQGLTKSIMTPQAIVANPFCRFSVMCFFRPKRLPQSF